MKDDQKGRTQALKTAGKASLGAFAAKLVGPALEEVGRGAEA